MTTPSSLAHPLIASFDAPLPWHTLNAQHPHARCTTTDVFRSLCAHATHRLSGVAYDDDPSLTAVTRSPNEGRDSNGVGRAFALVIDDVRIVLVEDYSDGHRSTASEVELEWMGPVRNHFVPVDVNVVWSPRVRWSEHIGDQSMDASLIELRCPYTQALILEVGTCWGDEHYPSMTTAFSPEAMAETARRAENRVLRETVDAAPRIAGLRATRPRL